MTSFTAIDPSKSNTGWATWSTGWDAPRYGSKTLGSEYTTRGQTLVKMRELVIDLYTINPIDFLFYEAPIAHKKGRNTSLENIRLSLALTGIIDGVACELRCRHVTEIEPDHWQTDFCGRDERSLIKRAARAAGKSARDPIKEAVKERCRLYGFQPQNSDEADAIGVLTYGILSKGFTPPWISNETLRPMLEGGRK